MWNEKYKHDEYFYGKEPNDFLKEHFQTIPRGGRVLCLADGEGRNSVFLAQQGFQVTAADSSERGLEKARQLAEENGVAVKYVCQDLAETDLFEQKWDGIVSIFCHLPKALRQQVHKKAVASLNKNGVFLLEAYTPEQPKYGTGGPPIEDLLARAEDVKNELAGLEFEIGHEIEREVLEGQGHTGLSHVTQILAQKV